MPRISTPGAETQRVTFNVTPHEYEKVVNLATRRATTVTDVIRRTAALQAYFEQTLGTPPDTSSIPEPALCPGILLGAEFIRGNTPKMNDMPSPEKSHQILVAIQYIR